MGEDQINELITGVYEGKYTPNNLPDWLYNYTNSELSAMVSAGFGKLQAGDVLETEKAFYYRGNISRFSGAKTFQTVKELTDYVFNEDGKKRNFKQFQEKALSINKDYNITWLKTEQDTAFLQSQNARKWLKVEAEADIFPILEYVAVGDDRTRPSHAKLNGLKARVNDPIWNRIHPQNGWRCRCIVIQHSEAALTSKVDKEAKTKLIDAEFKKNPTFEHNPGKVDWIFKENGKGKHDYFKVPKEYREDLKNNFGW